MTLPLDSRSSGTRLTTFFVATAALLFGATACAQDEGEAISIDPNVVNLFIESRTQKPASEATSEQRTGVIEELTDIYLVTDLPKAKELAKVPTTNAQLELQRRAILFNAFATDFLRDNPATEQEIFNTYESQVASSPPKEYKARHILVATQAEANDVVEELQDGADFAKLAESKSTGPSATSGGDLGWFPVGAMVKPFSDAVVALEDGATTKLPVQTQFGWHVILREESRDGTAPPLDTVRDAIKQRVEQEKFQAFMKTLR